MWICSECGNKYGKARFTVSTFHAGICEWCGRKRAVTEDRDYGYPNRDKITPVERNEE